jgi:hypothetical protein
MPCQSPFEALHRMQDRAIDVAQEHQPPPSSGSGIVIVAGGPRFFTNAYVALTVLRRDLGCSLPIQVWHLGPEEMSERMAGLLKPLDVEIVDAHEVRRRHPVRVLGGWSCKPFAAAFSPFQHIILLDADNVPLRDPASLLRLPEYEATGALFWPDISFTAEHDPIWDLCQVPYRHEPEWESGQIALDKHRCWVALRLALHFNEWSDIYYQYMLGDKETFHMAWRHLDQPVSMTSHAPVKLVAPVSTPTGPARPICALEQHDFQGRRLFHHRTGFEWHLFGVNARTGRRDIESRAAEILDDLRERWDGRVDPGPEPLRSEWTQDPARRRRFLYRRVGYGERPLVLEPDGSISVGAAQNERRWRQTSGSPPEITVSRPDGDIFSTRLDGDGVWRGRWLHYEQMPVELIPLDTTPPNP